MLSLSEADRRALLEAARRAISGAVTGQKPATSDSCGGIFAERRGAFVTIHARGRLRGCIGIVEPYESLGETISHCAVSAATQDPRFSPVRAEELADLQLEISLLSPPVPIRADDVEIGKHGLLVVQDRYRGLLLPQVATEHKLNREQFLGETCRKAGLHTNAWQEPETQIFGFTCDVFSESESTVK
jgi:AmmeMemoRadiSam system protein A